MYETLIAGVIANADKITAVTVSLVASIILVVVVFRFLGYISKRDTEQTNLYLESQKAQNRFLEISDNFVGVLQSTQDAYLSLREANIRVSDLTLTEVRKQPEIFTKQAEEGIRKIWQEHDSAEQLFRDTTLQRLNEILSRLQDVIATSAMMNGVMVVGNNNQIISLNDAGEKILGVDRQSFVGTYIFNTTLKMLEADGVTPIGPTDFPSQTSIREKKQINNRLLGIYNEKEGVWRWVIVNVEPVFFILNPETIQYVVVTLMDAGRLVGVMNSVNS